MNIKQWMEDILIKLTDGDTEDIELSFITERLYVPDAVFNRSDNGITFYGNPPSFVRIGIAYMLAHELAHYTHNDIYGDPGDDYSEQFQEIERMYFDKVWELCLDEHEE
jgi:hypothetical protein